MPRYIFCSPSGIHDESLRTQLQTTVMHVWEDQRAGPLWSGCSWVCPGVQLPSSQNTSVFPPACLMFSSEYFHMSFYCFSSCISSSQKCQTWIHQHIRLLSVIHCDVLILGHTKCFPHFTLLRSGLASTRQPDWGSEVFIQQNEEQSKNSSNECTGRWKGTREKSHWPQEMTGKWDL